jgi:FAD:protein FMN transferase
MGTTYSVRYVLRPGGGPALDAPTPEEVKAAIERELELVNQQMSTYIADSEISQFNQSRSLEWFEVSPETADVVSLAQQISALSDGLFDVTVMPLVNAWGFGPQQAQADGPSAATLADLLQHVGYQKLDVRLAPPALRKSDPELTVDLSAIAKGHGSDRISAVLTSLGLDQHFVEIGGEVIVRGMRADGTPWRLGIESPIPFRRGIQAVLPITDCAVATSGDYRNFHEVQGRRVTHTIHPKTGQPQHHDLASVTVIADDCATADAWATALMASGPELGRQVADRAQLNALFIIRDGSGFNLEATPRFRQQFPELLP